MRQIYQNITKDDLGNILSSCTIVVYETGTSNVATFYLNETGGVAVTSATSDAVTGYFRVYVDPKDYELSQKFDITISRTNYSDITFYNVDIFKEQQFRYVADPSETDQGLAGNGNTIKALVDAIGSDDESIFLPPGTYTGTTDETIPANITIHRSTGALISGTWTLTINGGMTGDMMSQWFDSTVTVAGSTKVQQISPLWWGAEGNGVADDTSAIQAAVTLACTNSKKLIFPAGGYRISSTITFPNTSFVIEGEGPTATYIKPLATATTIDLFDFTGCNGPAKVVRGISFEGPAPSVYGSGAAIKASSTNGLYLDNVWFRGIKYGLHVASGSYINTNQCVAEYCFIACQVDTTLDESIWYGWTFYKNETDISVDGAQKTFTIRDFNAIATKTNVLFCTGSGLLVDGITVQNDGTAYTPNIINLTGGYNQISNVRAKDFGSVGIFLQGANATKNRISNVNFEGVATGIFLSVAGTNFISNCTLKDCTTQGIRVDTANNNVFENFHIEGCDYGVSINANDLTGFHNGTITGSTTADWHQTAVNTGRLIIDNVTSNQTGLAGVEYLMSILPSGNYLLARKTIPVSAYSFTVGDVAINVNPVVGSPKGWRCTVAGTPGTWVSEGNL